MTSKKQHIICPNDNELSQFIEGTLSEERENFILQHLDKCEECAEAVRLATEFNAFGDDHQLHSTFFIPNYHAASKKNSDFDNGKPNHVNPNIEKDILNEIQQKEDTCAIKVQQLILEERGIKVSERELINDAIEEGWYIKGKGMLLEHIGKILNKHGIRTERILHAKIHDIVSALENGNKVIVGVDSGEIWSETQTEKDKEREEDAIEEIPDHVVLVEGITIKEEQITSIAIKDPGIIEKIKEVPVDDFIDAWHDSKCFMIKTK